MHFVLLRLHFRKVVADGLVQILPLLRAEVAHRRCEPDLVLILLAKILIRPGMLRLGPRVHRAVFQRQAAIRDNQVHVVVDRVAEPLASRARAHRTVEAEQIRLRLNERQPTSLAGELLAKVDAPVEPCRQKVHLARLAIADLHRVDDPLMLVRRNRKPVHQHLDRLTEVDIEQRFRAGELKNLPVLE